MCFGHIGLSALVAVCSTALVSWDDDPSRIVVAGRQQSVGIMRSVLNRMMEAREREARRYIATHYGKRFGTELFDGEMPSQFESRAPQRG